MYEQGGETRREVRLGKRGEKIAEEERWMKSK